MSEEQRRLLVAEADRELVAEGEREAEVENFIRTGIRPKKPWDAMSRKFARECPAWKKIVDLEEREWERLAEIRRQAIQNGEIQG